MRRRLGAGVMRAPRLAGGRAEGSRRVGRRPRQRRAMGAPEVDRGCAAGETEVERRLSHVGTPGEGGAGMMGGAVMRRHGGGRATGGRPSPWPAGA